MTSFHPDLQPPNVPKQDSNRGGKGDDFWQGIDKTPPVNSGPPAPYLRTEHISKFVACLPWGYYLADLSGLFPQRYHVKRRTTLEKKSILKNRNLYHAPLVVPLCIAQRRAIFGLKVLACNRTIFKLIDI